MDPEKSKIINTLIDHIQQQSDADKAQWLEALCKVNCRAPKSGEINYYKNVDKEIFTLIQSTTEIVERFVSETNHIINGGVKKKSQKFLSYVMLLMAFIVLLAAGFAVGYFFYPYIDKILDILLFSKKF